MKFARRTTPGAALSGIWNAGTGLGHQGFFIRRVARLHRAWLLIRLCRIEIIMIEVCGCRHEVERDNLTVNRLIGRGQCPRRINAVEAREVPLSVDRAVGSQILQTNIVAGLVFVSLILPFWSAA